MLTLINILLLVKSVMPKGHFADARQMNFFVCAMPHALQMNKELWLLRIRSNPRMWTIMSMPLTWIIIILRRKQFSLFRV